GAGGEPARPPGHLVAVLGPERGVGGDPADVVAGAGRDQAGSQGGEEPQPHRAVETGGGAAVLRRPGGAGGRRNRRRGGGPAGRKHGAHGRILPPGGVPAVAERRRG